MKKSEVETTGLKQNSTLDSLNFTNDNSRRHRKTLLMLNNYICSTKF